MKKKKERKLVKKKKKNKNKNSCLNLLTLKWTNLLSNLQECSYKKKKRLQKNTRKKKEREKNRQLKQLLLFLSMSKIILHKSSLADSHTEK